MKYPRILIALLVVLLACDTKEKSNFSLTIHDQDGALVATFDINDIESVRWDVQCYQLTPQALKRMDSLDNWEGRMEISLDDVVMERIELFNILDNDLPRDHYVSWYHEKLISHGSICIRYANFLERMPPKNVLMDQAGVRKSSDLAVNFFDSDRKLVRNLSLEQSDSINWHHRFFALTAQSADSLRAAFSRKDFAYAEIKVDTSAFDEFSIYDLDSANTIYDARFNTGKFSHQVDHQFFTICRPEKDLSEYNNLLKIYDYLKQRNKIVQ